MRIGSPPDVGPELGDTDLMVRAGEGGVGDAGVIDVGVSDERESPHARLTPASASRLAMTTRQEAKAHLVFPDAAARRGAGGPAST